MTLTNYWWLLIWLVVAGGLLTVMVPKQPVQIMAVSYTHLRAHET